MNIFLHLLMPSLVFLTIFGSFQYTDFTYLSLNLFLNISFFRYYCNLVLKISFCKCLFLAQRNKIDFCTLTLYPAILLNSLILVGFLNIFLSIFYRDQVFIEFDLFFSNLYSLTCLQHWLGPPIQFCTELIRLNILAFF